MHEQLDVSKFDYNLGNLFQPIFPMLLPDVCRYMCVQFGNYSSYGGTQMSLTHLLPLVRDRLRREAPKALAILSVHYLGPERESCDRASHLYLLGENHLRYLLFTAQAKA